MSYGSCNTIMTIFIYFTLKLFHHSGKTADGLSPSIDQNKLLLTWTIHDKLPENARCNNLRQTPAFMEILGAVYSL